MSWNTCLFCYAQERGGTFFGLQQETNFGLQQEPYEGSLLLEDPKGQILIGTKVTYSGRYGTNRDISVAVRAALERPYTLRVKKQSALQEGVNTVLDGLDLPPRISLAYEPVSLLAERDGRSVWKLRRRCDGAPFVLKVTSGEGENLEEEFRLLTRQQLEKQFKRS